MTCRKNCLLRQPNKSKYQRDFLKFASNVILTTFDGERVLVKKSICCAFVFTAATVSSAHAEPFSAAKELSWMLGCWQSASGSREYWSVADYPIVIKGEGYSLQDGALTLTEKLTITPVGRSFLLVAEPVSQPVAIFSEIDRSDSSIIFQNSDHDYPQKIIYRRSSSGLEAIISLADDSKTSAWSYAPCTDEN